MIQANSAIEQRFGEDGRVRRATSSQRNRQIDRQIEANVARYVGESRSAIEQRINALGREWDIERALEVNASSLALTGLALGITVDRRWLALPAVVMGFLLQHGVQGWCPPLPLLRQLGFRTRGEIDREKYQLLSLL
jgi:hypothetical protein